MLLTPPPEIPSWKMGSLVAMAPVMSEQFARPFTGRIAAALFLSGRTDGYISPTPMNSLGSAGVWPFVRNGALRLLMGWRCAEFHCFLVYRCWDPTLISGVSGYMLLTRAPIPLGATGGWLMPLASMAFFLLLRPL